MSETSLILKAYYEALYERLETGKAVLVERIDGLITQEVEKRAFEGFDDDKYTAYKEAALAFIDERIELYNPIGIQYTFDRTRTRQAFELELQLNWYDSRDEFRELVEAAHDMADGELTDEKLKLMAEDLIRQEGAFPDKSIISTYEAAPSLQGLPDYIVARLVEELIKE